MYLLWQQIKLKLWENVYNIFILVVNIYEVIILKPYEYFGRN